MTDQENLRYDRMTFTVPQAVLELHAGLFLDKLHRVTDLLTEGSNANRDAADAPSQEGIGKKQ